MKLRLRRLALAAVWAVAGLWAAPAAAQSFQDLLVHSSTVSSQANRLCYNVTGGIALACPSNAPYLTNGGNLGIGTNNPGTELEVVGTVSATQFSGTFVGDGSGLTNVVAASSDRIISGTTQVIANNGGNIDFKTGSTLTGYYTPAGILTAVGISTTNAVSAVSLYASTGNIIDLTATTGSINSLGVGNLALSGNLTGAALISTASAGVASATAVNALYTSTTNLTATTANINGLGVGNVTMSGNLTGPALVSTAAAGVVSATTLKAETLTANTGTVTGDLTVGGNLNVSGSQTIDGVVFANGGISASSINVGSVNSPVVSSTYLYGHYVSGSEAFLAQLTATTGTITNLGAGAIAANTISTTGQISATSLYAGSFGTSGSLIYRDANGLLTASSGLLISSTTGSLGVGADAPSGLSNNAIYASGNLATGAHIYFMSGSGASIYNGSNSVNFGGSTNKYIAFTTSGTEALRIVSTGYVGIGTTNPSYTLHVIGNAVANGYIGSGGVGSTGSLRLTNSLGGLQTYLATGNTASYINNGYSNAGLGIATSTPSTTLHVSGTIRIANGGEACDTNRAGAIRYTNGDFQVCYGTGGWSSLVDTSGTTVTPDRITSGTTNVYSRSDGSISFTTAGTTTGYFYNGQLVASAVSTTGAVKGTTISGTAVNAEYTSTTNLTATDATLSTLTMTGATDTITATNVYAGSVSGSTGTFGTVGVGNLTASGVITGQTVTATAVNAQYISGTTITATTVYGQFIGDGSGLINVTAANSDRITSGTSSIVAYTATGLISVTQSGTNTAYFHPSLGLVSVGVSTTGTISATSLYAGNFGTSGSLIFRDANGLLTASSNILISSTTGSIGIGAAPAAGAGNNALYATTLWATGGVYAGGGMYKLTSGGILYANTGNFSGNALSIGLSTAGLASATLHVSGTALLTSWTGINMGTRATPTAPLDVSGSIKISGDGTEACSASSDVGKIRINPSTGRLQVCK